MNTMCLSPWEHQEEPTYEVKAFYVGYSGDPDVGMPGITRVWDVPIPFWMTRDEMMRACESLSKTMASFCGDDPLDVKVTCDAIEKLISEAQDKITFDDPLPRSILDVRGIQNENPTAH